VLDGRLLLPVSSAAAHSNEGCSFVPLTPRQKLSNLQNCQRLLGPIQMPSHISSLLCTSQLLSIFCCCCITQAGRTATL
jgi:hypothetical protein